MDKFKLSGVKVCMVEGNGEERERFWNDLGRIVDRIENWYRLCAGRPEWMDWR